ncbi:MAG: hypothetical protein GT589_00295 [Peptoclostridium sp.]|uniref:YveK family protein n=1 Tax=Peptoclostridium sp. TaxID=1904860 RepID=UPI00139EE9BC|nr:Wzz/FepE/Etk N-terminal domain-containing protein [Peptoclostridium sp.]MZQ74583.1 hypothetical protein [Peptoclostridium sp.]
MEETIDLREYFEIVKKHMGMIALITILAVTVSAAVSFFVLAPVYETSTTLMVNKAKEDTSRTVETQDIMLSRQLVTTYGEIAKSNVVLNSVIKELGLDMDSGLLSEKITITPVKETEIMKITVSDTSPKLASSIANTTAGIFMGEVSRIMKIDNVQIIDRAEVPKEPIKPNKLLNIAIAGVLGIMAGVFIAFLREYLDNTIKTPEDIEKHLDVQVVGMIPIFDQIEN